MRPLRWNPTFCRAYVTPEGCRRASCSKRHDIVKCSCGLVLFVANLAAHKIGRRHEALLQYFQQRLGPTTETTKTCPQCNKDIDTSRFEVHLQQHARQERVHDAQRELKSTEQDKEGITVSHKEGVEFGIIEEENVTAIKEITIHNTTNPEGMFLLSHRMRSSVSGDRMRFSVALERKSKWIRVTSARTLIITFHPAYEGHYTDTLELLFLDPVHQKQFIVTRRVEATVGSQEDQDHLRAKAPYVKRETTPFQFTGPIDLSLRPTIWTPIKWATHLPEYTPPKKLITAVYGPNVNTHKKALDAVKSFMPRVFNESTYTTFFQTLLYIEEEQMRQDLDKYSLFGVELKSNYPRYDLLVKGLAEGRPSVLVGDFILFSNADTGGDNNNRNWYQGCVHRVHLDHVSMRFGEDFSLYRGSKFDVRFVLNRLPNRRMHYALVKSPNPTRLLFPGSSNIITKRVTPAQIQDITPVYRPLGEDEEQLETVASIVNQRPGSVPFVVFGPPGTGKTVTIVEAMRQLIIRSPDVRILACAPSNSAADLIAQKLLVLGPSQLLRLNSLSRKFDDLPKTLRDVSLVNENKVFVVPSLEELRNFRVIVATCIAGGIPQGLGLQRGHFTHIFIDEAGQAKEPEVMVPIKALSSSSTNIILAGDNQQLGPVIHSRLARDLGLKKSYLDRIMGLDIYDLKKFSGMTIIKLVKNFRSHPDLLRFSNEEFYNSELQACGDPMLTHLLENADELPKKKFPMVFHGIIGRDQQESSSPSFFNIDEATLVKKYCKSLVENYKRKILPEHIGVITPYYAQRCKILDLLNKDPKLRGITVGSVEEFQGQERRVIIMSTVRSNTNHVEADIKRSLGFVANPRRFNVAITRAQALLIVIGNPIILSLDPVWRKFLNFIHSCGGWRGKEINWDPEVPINPGQASYAGELRDRAEREMDETIERLKAVIVNVDNLEILSEGSDSEGEDGETPSFREAE